MYIFEIFTTNLNFYVVAPNLREALNLGESVFYRVYGKKADYLDEVYRCERLDYVDEISADPKRGK